ncbi:MAG TPA: pseudouridine synthase [Candidatus Paceibacterota bacterium]|nr:pseudouridine synthase [Candidatus Paceibacterota bacterium]
MDDPAFPMRINKYLAWKKHSTRRGADDLIRSKKVFINGRPAVLGDQVQEKDHVEVRFTGKQKPYVYLAYNKPRGIVTHSPAENEKEILDQVPLQGIFPIGRLDKDSHGLIILTNDGRITDRLLSPEYSHEKEYVVKTKEKLRQSFKSKMEAGVRIEREVTAPAKVEIINDHTFKIILTEGKKHQIRRMCSALFQEVADLERIRVMNIKIDGIKEGRYREIEGKELKNFLSLLGM